MNHSIEVRAVGGLTHGYYQCWRKSRCALDGVCASGGHCTDPHGEGAMGVGSPPALGDPGRWVDFDEIAKCTRANRGYLRVALRILVACGWLTQNLSQAAPVARNAITSYALTPEGEAALGTVPSRYLKAACLIPHALRLEQYVFQPRQGDGFAAVREYASSDASPDDRVHDHLNGLLAGPAMVMLARRGVLSQLEAGAIHLTETVADPDRVRYVFDFLARLGWLNLHGDRACLTSAGRYASQIAASYGVTVSYLPMLAQLSALLFGDPTMPRTSDAGTELLVDRSMNVWGSGGAHRTYFSKVDDIVSDIFNRPLECQPAGICDMGCGDGSFLEHLYSAVQERTLRGEWLDIYPLLIVGVDFNQAARRAAKETLDRAGVPGFQVIHGNINDPEQLSADLWDLGLDIRIFCTYVRSSTTIDRIWPLRDSFRELAPVVPPEPSRILARRSRQRFSKRTWCVTCAPGPQMPAVSAC